MANPQLEEGHTRIANEILEHLCKVNLSAYESRVLLFIFRTTYGWQRAADRIALSQISAATGLNKGNVGRAVRCLKKRNLLLTDGNQIGFQKDHEKWVGVSRKTPGGVSRNTVSPKTTKRCLPRHRIVVSQDTTKEIKIKESMKAKPSRPTDSDPRIKEITETWARLYVSQCNERYHFTGKDFRLFKSALTTFDVSRLKELAKQFFENADRWVKKEAGFTVGVFVSKLNSLASTSRASLNGTVPDLEQITI